MKHFVICFLLAAALVRVSFSQVIFNQAVGRRSNAAGHFDKNGSLHVVIQGDSLGRSGNNEKHLRYLSVSNDSTKIDELFDAPNGAIAGVFAATPDTIHLLIGNTNAAEGYSPIHFLRTHDRWTRIGPVPLEVEALSPLHSATAIVSDGTLYYFYVDLREAGRSIIHCSAWQPSKGWSKLPPVNSSEEVQSLACAGDLQSQHPALGWITKSGRCTFISEFDPGENLQKVQNIPITTNTTLVLRKIDSECCVLTISDLLKANWERQQSNLKLYRVGETGKNESGFVLTDDFPSKLDRPYFNRNDEGLTLVWSSSAEGQAAYQAPRDLFCSTQPAEKWSEPRKLNLKSADHLGLKILDGSRQNGRLRIGVFLLPSGLMNNVSHNSRVEIIEIGERAKK
jgi:hypothetical protein